MPFLWQQFGDIILCDYLGLYVFNKNAKVHHHVNKYIRAISIKPTVQYHSWSPIQNINNFSCSTPKHFEIKYTTQMLCLLLHYVRDSVVGSMFSGQRPFLFFGNGQTPQLLCNFFLFLPHAPSPHI